MVTKIYFLNRANFKCLYLLFFCALFYKTSFAQYGVAAQFNYNAYVQNFEFSGFTNFGLNQIELGFHINDGMRPDNDNFFNLYPNSFSENFGLNANYLRNIYIGKSNFNLLAFTSLAVSKCSSMGIVRTTVIDTINGYGSIKGDLYFTGPYLYANWIVGTGFKTEITNRLKIITKAGVGFARFKDLEIPFGPSIDVNYQLSIGLEYHFKPKE